VKLESLSSLKDAAGSNQFIQMVVALAAIILTTILLTHYTKKELARMTKEAHQQAQVTVEVVGTTA
jgi:hypothetical protein